MQQINRYLNNISDEIKIRIIIFDTKLSFSIFVTLHSKHSEV